jgi:hypothetical protein
MKQETLNLILLLTPLAIGGIIAAINSESVNDNTEKAEAWTRKTQNNTSQKDGWFSSYLVNPVLWMIVKFSDWTDSFTHRGLKNGIRVAATLYLIAAVIYLLIAVFVIMVALAIGAIVLYVVFKVLLNSNQDVRTGYETGRSVFQDTSQNEQDLTAMVGVRGQKIYSGTNWFNEELKGRVDEDGNIYSGTNWFSEEKIGRIDEEGTIYKGTSFFNEEKVGRIDEDGYIHKGTNWFNEEKTGRIDEDGNIHKGSNWFNEEKTGRIGN